MTNGKTRPFQMEDGCGGNYGVVVFESIFVTCTNRGVSKWNTRDEGGKNMHMKFRRASAFNQCVYKWNTNGIQMEYRGCAQDVSWSTFVQSRRFYFRCAFNDEEDQY